MGTSGTSGTSGKDGTLFGSSGSSGTDGSGTSGSSGTSGLGTNGTSGTSGTAFVVDGTTDNGVLTYVNSTGHANANSNITFNGTLLDVTGAIQSTTYRETYSNLGTGASVTLDLSTANNFRRQFNGTATITVSNVPSTAFGFTLVAVNAGGYTITFPPGTRFAGGTGPQLTTSGTDILVFYTYDGGSTYYAFVSAKNMIAIN